MNDTTLPIKNSTRKSGSKPTQARKVGLRKGFSLGDWIQLKNASKDLAQRKGKPLRNISIEEVNRHNSEHDSWIILRGKVYNLTPYLHYHPGGISIFKNFYGKDCTEQFDKYHRWVNIDALIGNLLLGFAVDEKRRLKSLDEFPIPLPRRPTAM
mmetsp:Transcript_21515/g.27728  ORF Transcript_21515/g.27728 Transcript_21515/m.27728 type:complete len:154 (-) Transcript_21515:972-1433(-)|eukprot:CAMPEP_0116075344 /NCGR_PEP_ID=MMETSP0322-20121206/16562_1 /TAXON_ID=163516 /ORGANISM="Leptocylindrus danicus var. apora, Strain B651" /LENGTH=153 /DNA_ID=CAMNT_0003565351 /DNA_START=109 /DNA_END=570 /DNA_ORIENTATION=+